MKNKRLTAALLVFSTAFLAASCGGGSSSSTAGSSNPEESQGTASSTSQGSFEEHTPEEVEAYMDDLLASSEANHLYFHYLRYDNTPASYADYDVWCWPYQGEGSRFDWAGRTTPENRVDAASGEAKVDPYGGAYIDVDLGKTYDGGWDAENHVMGGTSSSFYYENGSMVKSVGLQIVYTPSRLSDSGFWINDGGDMSVKLSDFAYEAEGGTAYHVFALQDRGSRGLTNMPAMTIEDPFAGDDGTNVTYDNPAYDNVGWDSEKAIAATSPLFKEGTGSAGILEDGAGTGYQIMVSSFADSDGDGMGDIYGITQKLDYLKDLGVEVLWLTPIQLSNSYHGYDINDYTKVDPKFGSSSSPHSNGADPTEESAMEDYLTLLEEAHKRGMAVIMDLVINHTSSNNAWFIDSAQLNEDYRGYYQWGNHETQEGIGQDHFWYPYGDHPYSYYAKFGSSMPELNYSYLPTREAVKVMAKSWLAKGVDGFRMDAVKHIFLDDEVAYDQGDTIVLDNSASGDYSSNLTKNLHFWRDIIGSIKEDYPDAFFVGENFDGSAYQVAPYYEGFDSLFDFYSYYNFSSSAKNALENNGWSSVQSWNGYQPLNSGSVYNPAAELKSNRSEKSGLYGSTSAMPYSGRWNLSSIFATYESYRTGKDMTKNPEAIEEYSFINGGFTSNHDIARMINRIAGEAEPAGISAQGNVTADNYDLYLQAATCAEIAIITLPGLSWLYYGDELGMTGNFKEGQDSLSSYADLAYRQPMKWTADGEAGDGSMTTGFGITGSGTAIAYDDINSTSLVTSVEEALEGKSEHFDGIKAFMNAKASIPALERGSYKAHDWKVGNTPVTYVHNVERVLDGETYNVVVNFSPSATLEAGFKGTLVASYNGATLTSIPPLSALLVKVSA